METRFLLRLRHPFKAPLRHLRNQSTFSKPSTHQVNPIGDYYTSILESSASSISSVPPTSANTLSSPAVSSSDSPHVEDSGPAILFSSRLSSPLERRDEIQKKSTLISGVWVPPRPDEPENCCMSGCVNCVWDRYRDELEEWAAARKEADGALKKEKGFEKERRRRHSKDRAELMLGKDGQGAVDAQLIQDDDGGGSESNRKSGLDTDLDTDLGSEDLFKDVPLGIREFMKQEKRLKEKHARENSSGG